MKELNESELEKVSGGETYIDGTCSGCGKTFDTSNGLTPKYEGKKCQAKKTVYYCPDCGAKINFQRIVGDGS